MMEILTAMTFFLLGVTLFCLMRVIFLSNELQRTTRMIRDLHEITKNLMASIKHNTSSIDILMKEK